MNRFILSLIFILGCIPLYCQDDFYQKKAEEYTRDAEFYQKKADEYRREADFYLNRAAGYDWDILRKAPEFTDGGPDRPAKNVMIYNETKNEAILKPGDEIICFCSARLEEDENGEPDILQCKP